MSPRTLDKDQVQFVKELEDAYKTVGHSPHNRIRTILENCERKFSHLTGAFSMRLLQLRKLDELDKVITKNNIDPKHKDRWVQNTRSLAENSIREGVQRDLAAILDQVSYEVSHEAWSVIGPVIEAANQRAEDELMKRKQQAQTGLGVPVLPPIGGPIGRPIGPATAPRRRQKP